MQTRLTDVPLVADRHQLVGKVGVVSVLRPQPLLHGIEFLEQLTLVCLEPLQLADVIGQRDVSSKEQLSENFDAPHLLFRRFP
jgi:hypothetical protein